MKNLMTVTILSLFTTAAHAKTLVCMVGAHVDMDIKVEQALEDGEEKLSVVLLGMDGNSSRTYSGFVDKDVLERVSAGQTSYAVITNSDRQEPNYSRGAGLVVLEYNSATQRVNATVAVEDQVITGSCK